MIEAPRIQMMEYTNIKLKEVSIVFDMAEDGKQNDMPKAQAVQPSLGLGKIWGWKSKIVNFPVVSSRSKPSGFSRRRGSRCSVEAGKGKCSAAAETSKSFKDLRLKLQG